LASWIRKSLFGAWGGDSEITTQSGDFRDERPDWIPRSSRDVSFRKKTSCTTSAWLQLKETIRIMAEIDKVIEQHGGWPLVGSVPEGEGA
jgi:hypothetical protein